MLHSVVFVFIAFVCTGMHCVILNRYVLSCVALILLHNIAVLLLHRIALLFAGLNFVVLTRLIVYNIAFCIVWLVLLFQIVLHCIDCMESRESTEHSKKYK